MMNVFIILNKSGGRQNLHGRSRVPDKGHLSGCLALKGTRRTCVRAPDELVLGLLKNLSCP
jgi:hypothetical protein